MTTIVSKLLISTMARVSPSHLPGNQLEKAAWGQARAGQLFRVTNVRSGVDIEAGTPSEGDRQSIDTGAVTLLPAPVIWRDQRGHDTCLNYACIERFAGVFNPDQLIEALVFNAQDLSEDAARLIRFRFEFVDPALMPPSGRMGRADWARRLDDELRLDPMLESLVVRHWLAREKGKRLSATDKVGILENIVSPRILNSSYRNRGNADPDAQENGSSAQAKEPIILKIPNISSDVVNRRSNVFLEKFAEHFENARDLRSITKDLKEKHVQYGGDEVDPKEIGVYLATRDNFEKFKEALTHLCEYYEVSINEQPGE
jgi:hypothetical protein